MKIKKPSIYMLFVFLYIIPGILLARVNYTKTQERITESHINYRGKPVELTEKALYVNAKLDNKSLGHYSFRTLQDAVAYAKDGTSAAPTIIYLEPDVYWTDDPTSENSENKLIGLKISQDYVTLIGLSENPDHTVIAGDRGQMAGSIGNWNTIGIGHGFHARNITFGNYCNVDLVYALNPVKNHVKRQKTITQAQVITKAHSGEMDEWVFENCRFISFLNVFARSNEPHRAYYKDCFFQCTDDAIGTGDMNVFEKCSFKFYSNHPSGSASNIIQVYLGCKFDAVLRDAGANSTIYFAKKNNIFAFVDGVFTGNVNRLEWTDHPNDDARHYVHNNTLHGQPVVISASKPDLSVNLKGEALKAFKVDNEYNIYNLLRGDNDWDPAGQKSRLSDYANLPYRLALIADKNQIKAETQETATISYSISPNRARSNASLKWSVSDEKLLSIALNDNGTITVTGHNQSDQMRRGFVKAETTEGIQSLVYMDLLAKPRPAPEFIKGPSIMTPTGGQVRVAYTHNTGKWEDQSVIDWYRAILSNGSDTLKVAVSRLNRPLKTYALTTGDIGYYLVAKIVPKHQFSAAGKPVIVISRKIKASDITTKRIQTNFMNLPTQKAKIIRDGFWTADMYRPVDLSDDFKWEAGEGEGWAYELGNGGTFGRYGLMTTGRGARLLYAQAGVYKGMSVQLDLSPHKASGQGFGSATGQYLDIYIKFDVKTLTGYGLRIQRTPLHGDGVRFTLCKFVKGRGTPISTPVESSAFLPGCKVWLNVSGKTLTARVTTSSIQQKGQKDSGLIHEVNLSSGIEMNAFGGFGIQHTGTVSSGNRVMLEKVVIDYEN